MSESELQILKKLGKRKFSIRFNYRYIPYIWVRVPKFVYKIAYKSAINGVYVDLKSGFN